MIDETIRFESRARSICTNDSSHAPQRPARTQSISHNPAIIGASYRVRLATGVAYLEKQVSQLVSRMYGSRGLVTTTPAAAASRHAGQTSLAACTGDKVVGTLTVGVDAADGLLADTLYRPQIDEVRATGARVCEVTQLAMDSTARSPDLMATLFGLGFVLARHLHRIPAHPADQNQRRSSK